MRTQLPPIAFVLLLAGERGARADDFIPGLELGARLGFGVPLSDVDSRGSMGDPLGQTVGGSIPIWIDAGYRFSPRWFGGMFVAYAPGWNGGALGALCNSQQASCAVFDMRVGAEVQYRFAPDGRWDPWLGGGAGYESLNLAFAPNYGSVISASGFELLNLQAGVDLPVGARGQVGPFVAATASVFTNDGVPSSPALHEWLVFGVRATVDLFRWPADSSDPP